MLYVYLTIAIRSTLKPKIVSSMSLREGAERIAILKRFEQFVLQLLALFQRQGATRTKLQNKSLKIVDLTPIGRLPWRRAKIPSTSWRLPLERFMVPNDAHSFEEILSAWIATFVGIAIASLHLL